MSKVTLLVLAIGCSLAHADYVHTLRPHFFGTTDRIRGFDPVTSSDVSAVAAISRVSEGLYEFEYLARPYGEQLAGHQALIAELRAAQDRLQRRLDLRSHADELLGRIPDLRIYQSPAVP